MKKYFVPTLTVEEFRDLIASGDDHFDNQIRVSKDGYVYLSQEVVGADNLDNVACRYETFDAGNDYVGINAANDDHFIIPLYEAIKKNWKNGCKKRYSDDWRITGF